MVGFQNKVALENFLTLYERELKYITIGEVIEEMREGVSKNEFLRQFGRRVGVDF